MPSWKVHRLIGEIICFGFCSHEIDALIDNKGRHDAGRYDELIFVNEALMVLKKYGGNGLCYYILHHVLDRLQDLLVSELASEYEQYMKGHSIEEIYEGIRSRILDRLKNDPKTVIPNFLQDTKDAPEYEILHAMTRLVLIGIEFGLDCVIFLLITDVNKSGKPTTGSRTYYAILNKLFSSEYKITRSPQLAASYVETQHSSIVEFLTKIVKPAEEKCREIRNREELSKELTNELIRIFKILERYNVKLYVYNRRKTHKR